MQGMFDKERIGKLKKGVLIVNNARGAIMDTQAVVDGCNSGHIGGYSGDVWYPQPAPKDHPWRYMPNQAMTPHISGTTIDAHLRYAARVSNKRERYLSRYINDATGAIYGILKEASQLHGNANKKKDMEIKDEDAELLQNVSDRVITKQILSEKLAQHVEQLGFWDVWITDLESGRLLHCIAFLDMNSGSLYFFYLL
ncbi:unnamed protein product [Lactuca virosa]|uniref:D-isomer specific 2-hydroxyacid dehydrogenase NAD-binding domain-containing protein n=1 Tax=Lactuca virosa TaxID=75947 RepID=A0AAU9P417_9ASTR|nr:unnamed protein product [Lactuca virosa]